MQSRPEMVLGSSPLARGLQHLRRLPRRGRRIIPARAGFTPPRRASDRSTEDHPRSRGVYVLVGGDTLLRGRIIPARAGFTSASRALSCQPGDHPRSRGVYTPAGAPRESNAGSSPLARGLHWDSRLPEETAADHPRSRGVYGPSRVIRLAGSGSSPLARGLPDRPPRLARESRIIPARAGFTPGGTGCATPRKDHPRSRGVYKRLGFQSVKCSGSSPLARGLRAVPDSVQNIGGIIPARAGFTTLRNAFIIDTRDHPRSRGVYRRRIHVVRQFEGSSPLARGLPDRARIAALIEGSSPLARGLLPP